MIPNTFYLIFKHSTNMCNLCSSSFSLVNTKRFKVGSEGKGSIVCAGGSSLFLQGDKRTLPPADWMLTWLQHGCLLDPRAGKQLWLPARPKGWQATTFFTCAMFFSPSVQGSNITKSLYTFQKHHHRSKSHQPLIIILSSRLPQFCQRPHSNVCYQIQLIIP